MQGDAPQICHDNCITTCKKWIIFQERDREKDKQRQKDRERKEREKERQKELDRLKEGKKSHVIESSSDTESEEISHAVNMVPGNTDTDNFAQDLGITCVVCR